MMPSKYDVVLFDLLTALLDSWSLWRSVAGDESAGRRWRAEYLRMTYQTGPYRPYEDLVADAAEAVDLPRRLASDLDQRYTELDAWPGVREVLRSLSDHGVRLGVVTNCSERLGRTAASRVGVSFDAVVTAERAGYYKPNPAPYRLAMRDLGVERDRCLFVAGSPYDLVGTADVGLTTYWHDRSGLSLPSGVRPPLVRAEQLDALPALVLGR